MEQRVEHLVETIIGDAQNLIHILQRLEREGWELCGVDSDNRRFIFKRPITVGE